MPLLIDNMTSREALEMIQVRFPGEGSLARIYDGQNIIRGYELKLGHKSLTIVGNLISTVLVELFCDAHSYGTRKEILRRARRASRPSHGERS